MSYRFWIIVFLVSLFSRYFLISSLHSSVTHWLLSSMMFRLCVFVFLAVFFSPCSWFLVSYLHGHKTFLIWFQSSNVLRLALWPSMLSILEDIPGALKKNVYSTALGCNVLCIYLLGLPSLMCSWRPVVLSNFVFGWYVHWCKQGVRVLFCYFVSVFLYVC